MKLIRILVITLATALCGMTAMYPIAAHALPVSTVAADLKSDAQGGVGQTGSGGIKITSVFSGVVNILSVVVGALSVIFVILSGFRYVTSGGDSNRVSSAKNTLVYALVGVAIVALAQVLVHFVINAVKPCPTNSSLVASDPQCK